MNVHSKIKRFITPLHLKFFFCFSDDVQDDVRLLKERLYSWTKDMNMFIDLELKDWCDVGTIDLHYTKHTNQDVFDKMILQSDYVVFLFHNQFGMNTLHEWQLCSENKKQKPRRFLGLKQTEKNRNRIDEIKDRLKTDNIIFVKYSQIDQLALAIIRTLLKRCNARQRSLNKVLTDTDLSQLLSAYERKRLIRISNKYAREIKQTQLKIQRFQTVDIGKKIAKREHRKITNTGRISSLTNMGKPAFSPYSISVANKF